MEAAAPTLSRRHAAGAPSARGMLLTLLGEFVLPGDGMAWTSAVLAAFERLGVAEKATRERDASKVYLMTVHGSKGLEFDEVFIIGAAQGVFPNRGNLEEERRLFYVAMTRAREYLNISRPLVISDWHGNLKAAERSQFVSEALNI